MKKILSTSAIAITGLTIICTDINGQLVTNTAKFSGQYAVSKKTGSVNSSPFTRVNSAVMRNFLRTYVGVTNEKWIGIRDGFVAMFRLNDVDYQVAYDKKGQMVHTIRSYGEAQLSSNMRHLIKSSYYDYNINLVQEIETPGDSLTCIIHLIGKTELIDLGITDGEMQVLQKFKRSE